MQYNLHIECKLIFYINNLYTSIVFVYIIYYITYIILILFSLYETSIYKWMNYIKYVIKIKMILQNF